MSVKLDTNLQGWRQIYRPAGPNMRSRRVQQNEHRLSEAYLNAEHTKEIQTKGQAVVDAWRKARESTQQYQTQFKSANATKLNRIQNLSKQSNRNFSNLKNASQKLRNISIKPISANDGNKSAALARFHALKLHEQIQKQQRLNKEAKEKADAAEKARLQAESHEAYKIIEKLQAKAKSQGGSRKRTACSKRKTNSRKSHRRKTHRRKTHRRKTHRR